METRTSEVSAHTNMKCGLLIAMLTERRMADGVSELSITTAGGTKNNRKDRTKEKRG